MSTGNQFFRLDREIAKIEFNKSIAGCYRDGNAEYDAVGVLLLTWREDDMKCKEKEVIPLERVFQEDFNYRTEQYEIPPNESSESLLNRLNAFIRCYDSPSKLGIIYYGGHAEKMDTPNGTDLELFARRTSSGVSAANISRTNTSLSDVSIPESPMDTPSTFGHPVPKGPRPEQSHVSFTKICKQLKTSETDILLIVDSCFAAGAFNDQPFGGRKCELFCSIAEKDWARAPGHEGSFTKMLTNSLSEMIRESPNGFSTTDLYRRIYLQQHQAHKPFLFNQSRLDFGKIWLRPCRQKDESTTESESNSDVVDSKYTIDVRFHLTKSLETTELNKVVKALQWIPFVQLVRMQNMRSPTDDLSEFILTVHMANRLRPLLARIRRRLELKKAQQLKRTDTSSAPSSPVTNTTSKQFLGKEPRNVGLFDWSKAKAVTPRDEHLSPGEYFHLKMPSETSEQPTITGAALKAFSREMQVDASVERSGGRLQLNTNMRPSQRTLDGLLFFALGVSAAIVVRWVAQGSAAPAMHCT